MFPLCTTPLCLAALMLTSMLPLSGENVPATPAAPPKDEKASMQKNKGGAPANFEGSLPEVALPVEKPFTHPGILNTQADLDFVRGKIKAGEEPWSSAFKKMAADKFTSLEYKAKPVAEVYQGPYGKPDNGGGQMMRDGTAAYGHALMWALTGEKAHAEKSIEIVNGYASTLKSIDGPTNQNKVLAGWSGCKFAGAGELLRSYRQPDGTTSGWAEADATKLGAMFTTIFYPIIQDFQPGFNGNWDTTMMTTMAAMGIFLNDHAMFNKALNHYLNSESKGRLVHYIYPVTGQCQETVRDQAHTQMGLGAMATLCKMAESQGLDLWSAADNRLALGYEYTAKYNLGEDVPVEGGEVGAGGRGKWMSVWELVYQHYAIDKKMPMPYTERVIQKVRPEGATDIVFESWGTVLYYRGPAMPLPDKPEVN